jgi:hypothetical protein
VATTPEAQADFTAVVELARLAPSVHNTQPWLFRVAGDVLTLSRDPARRLHALDPDARQQTISCGAALYLARLALRLQGYDSRVEHPSALGDEGVLARIRAVPGSKVTAEELVLEHAARSRHTQRGIFENRPLPDVVVTAMRDAAEDEGAWVRLLGNSDEQVPLAVLLARAEAAEIDDPAYREELETWTHRPPGTRDGVPPRAIPDTHHRGSTLRLRDFAPADRGDRDLDVDAPPPVAEHVVAIVLGTVGDGVGDWLIAGQALVALLLRAVIDGVQASPMGQVVDQPWSRRRLAIELGVVGEPQMVLRVGHATPGPDTPRRPVGDILR